MKRSTRTSTSSLERFVDAVTAPDGWSVIKPLPTTRELGVKHRVSNTTAFRMLRKLEREGVLWQDASGRFYLSAAKRLLNRPKPVLCLIRNLEAWTSSYQGIMTGLSQACGGEGTGLLLVHISDLVIHRSLEVPPDFARDVAQRRLLEEWLPRHEGAVSGFMLDHVWSDFALQPFLSMLRNSVIPSRPTKLDGVRSVSLNFQQAALLGLAHLLACGYEKIWLVRPFKGDPAMESMLAACQHSSDELGRNEKFQVIDAGTEAERTKLIERVQGVKGRVGLFCPEDNLSHLLFKLLQAARLRPPQIGLLSGMGTSVVTGAGISSLQVDFKEMGVLVADLLRNVEAGSRMVQARLVVGSST